MLERYLPISTPYDPSDDPPGSVDPMGTVTTAEQLAEVLFPGLTARMWRVRHLTFAALAALVSERASALEAGSEEMRLEARLGFERLFVSAVTNKASLDPTWSPAARRLPGIGLARRALQAGHQPLGKQNFLKGQAVNGPFGVVQRLARNLDIINDENRLSRNGEALLLAWSAEQDLEGILDDTSTGSNGSKWMKRLLPFVVRQVNEGAWPKNGWWGWTNLADLLRPDQLKPRESEILFRLLTNESNSARKRCFELLLNADVVESYLTGEAAGTRGSLDREILVQQIGSLVRTGKGETDRLIRYAVRLIETHEEVSGYLEATFRALMWTLTRRGGRSTTDDLLGDLSLARILKSIRRKLAGGAQRFQSILSELMDHPQVVDAVKPERLEQLLEDSLAGLASERELVAAVMNRHRRVQQQKRKGDWIEQDDLYWTLLPGFGDNADAPWSFDGAYLHPFRVSNAFSFLSDLGKVPPMDALNGKED